MERAHQRRLVRLRHAVAEELEGDRHVPERHLKVPELDRHRVGIVNGDHGRVDQVNHLGALGIVGDIADRPRPVAVRQARDQREHHRHPGDDRGDQRTVQGGQVGRVLAGPRVGTDRCVALGGADLQRVVPAPVEPVVSGQRGKPGIRLGEAGVAVGVNEAAQQISRQGILFEGPGQVRLHPALGDVDRQAGRVGGQVMQVGAELIGSAKLEITLVEADQFHRRLGIDPQADRGIRNRLHLRTARGPEAGQATGGIRQDGLDGQVDPGFGALVKNVPCERPFAADTQRFEMDAALDSGGGLALGDEGDGTASGAGFAGWVCRGGRPVRITGCEPTDELAVGDVIGSLRPALAGGVVVLAARSGFPRLPNSGDTRAGGAVDEIGGCRDPLVRTGGLLQFAERQNQPEAGVVAGGGHRPALPCRAQRDAGKRQQPDGDQREEDHQAERDDKSEALVRGFETALAGGRWELHGII